MPNLIDRIVGTFSPLAGLRRHHARELLGRAYEGASPRDGWKPRRAGASANTDQAMDAQTLRIRARSLYQNVGYITRGVEAKVANVIGTGITPNSLAPNAQRVNQLWAQWASVADADGVFDLYGLMAAAYRATVLDGEVLIRKRTRRTEDGLPAPLQFQLLEIDWLDTAKTGTNGGNHIIAGIEYNPVGQRVAYWLFDQHPGEQVGFRRARTASRPVPAAAIIHLYNPARPGQGRGVTDLASIIARTRDLETYDDSERARKNLESRLAVLASGDVTQMQAPGPGEVADHATGQIGSLAGGSIMRVPDGVNLTVVKPEAVPGFAEYYRLQLHIIAAGMGVTYEMLTGDVSQVNFSSARVALLEFRRFAEQVQWLVLVPKMCAPIWAAFIEAAVLAGKLPPAQSQDVDWATPKWDYVNPVQDVNADLAEISGGLSSISEKLRRRGYKPDQVFKELKSDLDRLKADGTLDLLVMLQKGRTMAEATREPTSP
ncbi:MAG: phage portal protein [Burkholderiaceae bacterium]